MGFMDKKELRQATYLTLACAAVIGAVYLILVGIHRLNVPGVS
jgi:hypothetical protein